MEEEAREVTFTWWQTILVALISSGVVGASITAFVLWWNAREERKHKRQMITLTDAERREATQLAYTHWRKLVARAGGRDSEALDEALEAAQIWWDENCLYLEAEARRALQRSIILAANHAGFLATRDANLVRQNWEDLVECGATIEKSMDRPLSNDEP